MLAEPTVTASLTDVDEYRASAEAAGLVYVESFDTGWTRRRCGRGFSYLDEQGQTIKDPATRARLEALVIPPAWEAVWICPDPRGHLQVTGRDEAGRKQYQYHELWTEIRNAVKFQRLVGFSAHLPAIRERYDRDMGHGKLCCERVCAIITALLDRSLMRVGHKEYAEDNGHYGLATLTEGHVEVTGSRVHLEFVGKAGKTQQVDIRDRRLAHQVQRCLDLPGEQLFTYQDDDGSSRPIEAADINDYLREITGEDYTAKTFRTWGGTVLATRALLTMDPPTSDTTVERGIREAIKQTAEHLGNTPAVCRAYYVHPAVLTAYREGRLLDSWQAFEADHQPPEDNRHSLSVHEAFVQALLQQEAALDDSGVLRAAAVAAG